MERIKAWKKASELVEPIIERHGLEIVAVGGAMFTNPPVKHTKVDQHIDHIMRVAEWLREED